MRSRRQPVTSGRRCSSVEDTRRPRCRTTIHPAGGRRAGDRRGLPSRRAFVAPRRARWTRRASGRGRRRSARVAAPRRGWRADLRGLRYGQHWELEPSRPEGSMGSLVAVPVAGSSMGLENAAVARTSSSNRARRSGAIVCTIGARSAATTGSTGSGLAEARGGGAAV